MYIYIYLDLMTSVNEESGRAGNFFFKNNLSKNFDEVKREVIC